MNNICGIKNCYGCGVCAAACPRRIISLRLNSDGFYEPFVTDLSACIECGICRECCAYLHDEVACSSGVPDCYAAWSNRENIRRMCSSGGIGFEIGAYLLNAGYKACAVRYDAVRQCTAHFIASSVEDYMSSVGSKYIQSYTAEAFCSMDRREKHVVTGTPCQIDSFRRYIRRYGVEDNFVLVDFFCHGVPSRHAWTKYLEKTERKTGKVVCASWRDKSEGWRNSYAVEISGEKGSLRSSAAEGDKFFLLYLSNICLGKACYGKCKYKYTGSSADIRLGDLWGSAYRDNKEGVNAVLAFTDTGRRVISGLEICTLVPHSIASVTEGQLRKPLKEPFLRRKAVELLKKKNTGFEKAVRLAARQLRLRACKRRIEHPIATARRIIIKLKA